VIITAIALSSMRSSTQELRMAVNSEERVSAGQFAQALSDAVTSNPGSTPVVGDVGRRVCTPLIGNNDRPAMNTRCCCRGRSPA
jgi:archaellum component FlaG (FlaF/FlaG flagellin family)